MSTIKLGAGVWLPKFFLFSHSFCKAMITISYQQVATPILTIWLQITWMHIIMVEGDTGKISCAYEHTVAEW